jgi:hypothetical protein
MCRNVVIFEGGQPTVSAVDKYIIYGFIIVILTATQQLCRR